MKKIAFVEPNGNVHIQGTIGYIHDYDTNLEEIEFGPSLQELEPILNFVKDSFAPDYWVIKDERVQRFSKDDPTLVT